LISGMAHSVALLASMIPKSGNRFSDKIMLQKAEYSIGGRYHE
jgi:hypothetical protein